MSCFVKRVWPVLIWAAGVCDVRPNPEPVPPLRLPSGFHAQWIASPEICRQGTELTFGPVGQLLLWDGNRARELVDVDGDGIFDRADAVPEIERPEVRGWDQCVYRIEGTGGHGAGRKAGIAPGQSGFGLARVDLSGEAERLSTGACRPGRILVDGLGEMFSLDACTSEMAGLPMHRTARLIHWQWGGDHGWREEDGSEAYPIETVEPVIELGDIELGGAAFYAHNQFPARYQGALFVTRKRGKSGAGGAKGAILLLHLDRADGRFVAEMETFATAGVDADRDEAEFDPADVAVAPDGSLVALDLARGIVRMRHGTETSVRENPDPLPSQGRAAVEEALRQVEPGSAWGMARLEKLREQAGAVWRAHLEETALSGTRPIGQRVQAVRLLAAEFNELETPWLQELAKAPVPELRALAGWLCGIRGRTEDGPLLVAALKDREGYVRRRGAEAWVRARFAQGAPVLVEHLGDAVRRTRSSCMAALEQIPLESWWEEAVWHTDPQVRMRALVVAERRAERPGEESLQEMIELLLVQVAPEEKVEEQIDLLGMLGLLREPIERDPDLRSRVVEHILEGFPHGDPALRREQVRLLGEYQVLAGARE